MCGIAGIYTKDLPVDTQVVRAMTSQLYHRGPMDEGYLFKGDVGLGMRRLSIIDVDGGHQPIHNEDKSISVILNGEIYNYKELRSVLVKKGHKFSTQSDTEVIVHLYEEVGEKCLNQLNGMFAFALWDERNRRLLVARDRLGIKPLYYYHNNSKILAFASEMKALLRCPFITTDLDLNAFADYLTFMYIQGSRSPFKNIRKLLPGHYFIMDRSGFHISRYWDLRNSCTQFELSEPEAIDQIHRLLEDSIRLRMRSDVPVGAFLSGGLDSSAVVAYASKHAPRPIETFAVGFSGDGVNELGYAKTVSRAFNTSHHETTVKVDSAIQYLPKLIWHLDEPNGDSAIVPTYLVSQFASSQLRVILSGLGGDELFGGYSRYFDGYPIEHLYRKVPVSLRRNIIDPLSSILPPRIAQRIRWNSLFDDERYLAQMSYFTPTEIQNLIGYEACKNTDVKNLFKGFSGDNINQLLFVDINTYLPGDILHITDRMSMAFSLEARTPFLDHRLVEFCASLPSKYKVSQLSREWKLILKKAMRSILPQEILNRSKVGFNAPVAEWMSGGLCLIVKDVFRSSTAVKVGILNGDEVRPLIDRLTADPKKNTAAQKLWILLVLEVWCRVFLRSDFHNEPTFTMNDLRG